MKKMAGVNFLFGLAFFLISLFLTDWLFSPAKFMLYKYVIRVILISISGIFMIKSIFFFTKTCSKEIYKNLLALLIGVVLIIYILEVLLMFVPISHGLGKTLASKNWFNFYWHENSLGYRDAEPKAIDRPSKRNLLILGDSYVAGHGITKEANRFSNILRRRLIEEYDVFNVSICGADTKDEFHYLKEFPFSPDIVVLIHTKDDIRRVKCENPSGLEVNKPDQNPYSITSSPLLRPRYIVSNSFLYNFSDL